jgi:hypothetical protein
MNRSIFVWHLVDFVVCWMLLTPEARRLVYSELHRWDQPRVWRYACGDVVLVGG